MIKAKLYPDFKAFIKGFVMNVKAGKRYDFRKYQEAVLPLTYSSPWPESDIPEVSKFNYTPDYKVPFSDELLYSVGAQMRTADFFMDLQYAIINGKDVDTVYCEWLARVKPFSMLNAKLKDAAVAPVITQQPASQAVSIGSDLTLEIVATGATGYQWKKDGADIASATSATYTKVGVVSGDAGSYTCVVNGTGGASVTSDAAVVETYEVPVITTQPMATVNLTEGGSMGLSVTASHATGYQWFKDGSAISGQTKAVLNIASVTTADSGAYYCEVSGAHNSKVTSHESVVTVTATSS